MKKILILTFIICIFLNNISYCDDYDTQPLTLQNFNFEFDYRTPNLDLTLQNFNFEFEYTTPPNLDLTLQNFNFEFDYILQTFKFDLTEYISDYSRYKKLWELYPQLTGMSGYRFWKEFSILENEPEYRTPKLDYYKFKIVAAKYK